MRFADPTFIDLAVRRRASYKICNPDGKTRLCYLLADAITYGIEASLDRVCALMRWTGVSVPHVIRHDVRGVSDNYRVHALDIISRGWAACEATAEVFATLCWLAGHPSRTLSIQKAMPEPVAGHHVNEIFIDGKWSFFDADTYRYYRLADGSLASAWDLHHHPEVVREAEAKRSPEDLPEELQDVERERQASNFLADYDQLFGVLYVQEGIYSLDGFYGKWLKCTDETADYLYGPPGHPDVKRLVAGRLPFSYVRDSTKIADHFHRVWDVDWESWSED